MRRSSRLLSFRATHDLGDASVDAELHDDGAVLRVSGLHDPIGDPFPSEVRFTVRGEPSLEGAPYALDRPAMLVLSASAVKRDPVSTYADPLTRLVSGGVHNGLTFGRPRCDELLALLATVRHHLIRRCEPEARREAVRYSSWSHWFLYRRLVRDPSGRLLRASRSHPGLVALACGIEAHDWKLLAGTLFDGIEAGEAPAVLVDRFLREQVESDPKLYGVLEKWDWDRVEPWLESEPCSPIPLERAELHRRFLLRSGPELPPFLYAEPPPAGLGFAQLPRTPAEGQQHWGLREKLRRVGWWPRTPTPERFREAAAWIASHPRAKLDFARFGTWLAAGGKLTRRTRPSRIRRESAELTPLEFVWDPP